MTTAEFIITLFYRIDNQMLDVPKHPRASLYPSEVVVVTLGVLYALKGGGKRAFYRWLMRDWHTWFPRLPPHAIPASRCRNLLSVNAAH